jgi:ribosomal protein S15
VPISKEKPMIASSVKAEVVKSNARSANDTGSPEVQVALLTARINELACLAQAFFTSEKARRSEAVSFQCC